MLARDSTLRFFCVLRYMLRAIQVAWYKTEAHDKGNLPRGGAQSHGSPSRGSRAAERRIGLDLTVGITLPDQRDVEDAWALRQRTGAGIY